MKQGTIIEKYNRRVDTTWSMLCVGLDSELDKLPERFRNEPYPQFAFNQWIIDHTRSFAAAYKPNTAFYEARGAAGWRELEMTMEYLCDVCPDAVTVCDAKRADIGNTNRGYVKAVFDTMGFDAITLHPYLGREALMPFLEREDKASIILCRTSNAGAGEMQDLQAEGAPMWETVARRVSEEWNTLGNCMLVVGATYPREMQRIREIAPEMTFLVPGVGAQGGDVQATVAAGRDAHGRGLMISSSRGIIFKENPATAAQELRDEIRAAEVMHAAR